MNRILIVMTALALLVAPAAGAKGNPSGATPHQYKVYCASVGGVWVSSLQTCNGVPLSVWTGVSEA